MKNPNLAFLPLLTLVLAACGPAPSDQIASAPADTSQSTPAAPVPQVEVAPTTMIRAEPAAIAQCKPGSSVTLRWNVYQTKPEVKTVKIYTAAGKLFTHSGSVGSMETGPWVKPGTVFVLKDGADETELERLTIGGPICG